MTKNKELSWDNVTQLSQEICRQLTIDQWKPDYIIGLTRGGLAPAVMISYYFEVPMYTLKVSLRDNQLADNESSLWMAEEAFGYVETLVKDETKVAFSDVSKRKKMLIVDDINDSGATFKWIKQDWESNCCGFIAQDTWKEVWGSSVRFATLVNNENSEFKEVNYTAMSINKLEDPVYIVYPWEAWWKR